MNRDNDRVGMTGLPKDKEGKRIGGERVRKKEIQDGEKKMFPLYKGSGSVSLTQSAVYSLVCVC